MVSVFAATKMDTPDGLSALWRIVRRVPCNYLNLLDFYASAIEGLGGSHIAGETPAIPAKLCFGVALVATVARIIKPHADK